MTPSSIVTTIQVSFPICPPPPPPACNHTPPTYLPFTLCQEGNDQVTQLPSSCTEGIITCANGNPTPAPTIIDITCESGNDMDSYAARQVDVKYLWCLVDEANFCPYIEHDICSFCEQLNLLVSLKATMITYSAQYWGSGVALMDGTLPNLWGEMIASINYAFDCAGLKRPLIQGGIWETMASDVCRVEIPPCVINHFYDEIVAAGPDAIDRYLNQSPVRFSYRQICMDDPTNPFPTTCDDECEPNPLPVACYWGTPDFSKLETRMWFYHMGVQLIDAGFTSILIGGGPPMGAKPNGTDPYNIYQTSIVKDLKDYAANLPQPTELVFKLESGGDYLYANENGVFPSNQLLQDYHAPSFRPREIFVQNGTETPINVDDFNDQNIAWAGCENSDGTYDPAMFGPLCEGLPYLAFFDRCHSGTEDSVEGVEGTTPSGCETDNIPMAFTWDHGPTCYTTHNGPPGPPGQYYILQDNDPNDGKPCDLQNLQNCMNDWDPSSHSIWGWDEATWWSTGFKPSVGSPDPLTGIVPINLGAQDNDACRLEWLKKTMKSIRDLPGGNYFLVLKTFDPYEAVTPCAGTITPLIPVLDLSDPGTHVNGFQDMLAALLEPNLVNSSFIGMEETCIVAEGESPVCDIGCANIDLNQFRKKFTFYVKEPNPEDPDLTSLYKFRIEKLSASGAVLEVLSEFSYGKEKSVVLNDLQPGEKIQVTLQQINMGLISLPPYADLSGIHNDGVVEVSRIYSYEEINPCCDTDPIPVEVSRPAPCWLKLSIPYNEAAGVDQFYWTTFPDVTVTPQVANASIVWIDLSDVDAYSLVFCVAGIDENGLLKVGDGIVPLLNNECRNKSLIISPIPNPVKTSEMLNVLLSGDAMDEIQQNNTPLTLNIIRNSDGNLVYTFETIETDNTVDVSNFQAGMHWIITDYSGLPYSSSFIVSDQ